MAFTGDENHVITLDQATEYRTAFEENPDTRDIKGHYFGKRDLLALLNQQGCVGLRMYYAANTDDNNKPTLVIYGVGADEMDITANGLALDRSYTCPPFGV